MDMEHRQAGLVPVVPRIEAAPARGDGGDAAAGRVGIVHCSTWRDSWGATIDALEERDIAAINMVLLGIDEHDTRMGPTGKQWRESAASSQATTPGRRSNRSANLWCIDTGAGFVRMNRLSAARIDVDPPEIQTFEVIDR